MNVNSWTAWAPARPKYTKIFLNRSKVSGANSKVQNEANPQQGIEIRLFLEVFGSSFQARRAITSRVGRVLERAPRWRLFVGCDTDPGTFIAQDFR